jgi:hypothetical protein
MTASGGFAIPIRLFAMGGGAPGKAYGAFFVDFYDINTGARLGGVSGRSGSMDFNRLFQGAQWASSRVFTMRLIDYHSFLVCEVPRAQPSSSTPLD